MSTDRAYSLLIVDDDAQIRQTLGDLFQADGFEIHLAESGESALDIVENRVVHLALLDLYLPTLSGLETLEIARQHCDPLPAILITGAAEEDVLLRQALLAQIFCVIPKPLSRTMVSYQVSRALSRYYPDRVD